MPNSPPRLGEENFPPPNLQLRNLSPIQEEKANGIYEVAEKNFRYWLSPELHSLLGTQKDMGPLDKPFSLPSIVSEVQGYINHNGHLVERKNEQIIVIQGDPLFEIFKVKAFLKSQIESLISKAVFKICPITHVNYYDRKNAYTQTDCSSGLKIFYIKNAGTQT